MTVENKWNDVAVLAAVKRKVVDKLTVVGQFVKDSAVLLVPVDTGNLKGSIHFQVNESELSVRIGTPVEYAARIEFGFAGFDELGRFYDQQAQPYLRPALLNNKATILKMLSL